MTQQMKTVGRLQRNFLLFVIFSILLTIACFRTHCNKLSFINTVSKTLWQLSYGKFIVMESQQDCVGHGCGEEDCLVGVDLSGPVVAPLDPRVICQFRKKYLIRRGPHNCTSQYNLTVGEGMDPSMGQSAIVRRLFKDSPSPGFFIECGAMDGETRSNTLFLERQLGWKGLLIEPDPLNYQQLVHTNRQAWMSPTCLSTKPYPNMVSFRQGKSAGRIARVAAGYKKKGYVDVMCYPVETVLAALNVTTVDYFSLDVEGAELDVLRTIPFDKYNIKILSVEFTHASEGKAALREHMLRNGYVLHSEVTNALWLANDFIFVKKTFLDTFSSAQKTEIRRDIRNSRKNFKGHIWVHIGGK